MSRTVNVSTNHFDDHWGCLRDLGERIYRRGFDEGRLLGKADHEIRGLACHRLAAARWLVVAGDKLGHWYAATFDPATGEAADLHWRRLPPIPTADEKYRVVDRLQVVPWAGDYGVVVATRGNGVWLAPLERVLDPSWKSAEELIRLPGSEDRKVRRLLFDATSQALLAPAGRELLAWSLADAEPHPRHYAPLPFQIMDLTIDRSTEEEPGADHLYLATNRFDLHLVERGADGYFPVTADKLRTTKPVWSGRLSAIEHLWPLSAVGHRDPETGRWRRRYPQHRGVIAASLRHVLLVYHDEYPRELPHCHVRLVVARSKTLSACVLNLPRWHGIAVSTLEGNLRIFRSSGMRRPAADDYEITDENAPENHTPQALLSGYKDADTLPDRVYCAIGLDPQPGAATADCYLPVILGLGNNEVRWHRFDPIWNLRREAANLAAQMIEGESSLGELLERLQHIAMQPKDPRRDKNAIIQLIPELGRKCATAEHWRQLILLVWDVLARFEPDDVPVRLIQALRRLEVLRPEHSEELEENVTAIRKFVLDTGSFSGKQMHFLDLANSRDPGLSDDRVVYRSILISLRFDPVFDRIFEPAEEFGEVQTFSPVPAGEDPARLWDCPPEKLRFLATNFEGGLWLLDGTGRARRLTRKQPGLGHIRAFHVRGDDIVISFSHGGLRRVGRLDLLRSWDREGPAPDCIPFPEVGERPVHATAFATPPAAGASSEEPLLWGDREGCIHLLAPGRGRQLIALKENLPSPEGIPLQINELESWQISRADGSPRNLVIAGTASGHLFLMKWVEGEPPALEVVDRLRVGVGSVSALLVGGPDRRHVFVAVTGGLVTGLRLVDGEGEGDRPDPQLALTWAFRAEDTVRGIHPLDPTRTDNARDAFSHRIVIGSHDEHLYALDLEGRHIETYHLAGLKVDLFCTAPKLKTDGERALARVYGCTFENRFMAIRLIDRDELLKDVLEKLEEMPAEDREERITRWRAYRVREGHLRHRFIRLSHRYPCDVAGVLRALEYLIKTGDSSEQMTGEMTALLRRLFQNRQMGLPAGDQKRRGLRAILATPKLYREAVTMLRALQERWDTPGSLSNRRVQLFWIRSLLRNLEDAEMLRRWIEVGEAIKHDAPWATPGALLIHFLERSPELVQFKTLQYLERLLFGWPGVQRRGLLEPNGERLARGNIECFLEALLSRLRRWPHQVTREEPHPVILQIARLFCLLLRAGYLDPLYLSYLLQQHSVPNEVYVILAHQCDALATLPNFEDRTSRRRRREEPGSSPLRRYGEVLRQAHRVITGIEEGKPLLEILDPLRRLIDHCQEAPPDGADAGYLAEAHLCFRTLIPLLQADELQKIKSLAAEWKPEFKLPSKYYPSFKRLAQLSPFLEAMRGYWERKHEDQYLEPLCSLQIEDFDRVRREWRAVRGTLNLDRSSFSDRDAGILKRLIEQWDTVLEEEQQSALLQDFQFILEERYFREVPHAPTSAAEVVQLLADEERLALAAFSNLFTRLVLFAEPVEAIFFFRGHDNRKIEGRWFRVGDGIEMPWFAVLTSAGTAPTWLNPDWFDPDVFQDLNEETLENCLRAERGDRTWRVTAIPGTPDQPGAFGFYLFAWADEDAPGRLRFDTHRLTWALPLQALVFRQAAMQQEALKGRIFSIVAHNLGTPLFHMRTDLKILFDGFLEDQTANRFDKYGQLLRQARHMDGVVEGILALANREVRPPQLTQIRLDQLVYEIVQTVRKEAEPRRVKIEAPRPAPGPAESSQFVTDEAKLYDILLNVIVNAVKYSPPRGTVTVSLEVKAKGAEVRVTDQGPGIPEHERRLIFDPFFRGSQSQIQKVPGLGLGLYVADLYVNMLKGRIQGNDEPEGGTRFTVFLPTLSIEDTVGDSPQG